MDNKITKSRLKTFFTYDLIKVVAVILASCTLLMIIFNAVAEKLPVSKSFMVICDDSLVVSDEGKDLLVSTTQKKDGEFGFSYEIMEVQTNVITRGDFSSSYILKNNIDLSEDDVFIGGKNLSSFYLNNAFPWDIVKYTQSAKNFCLDNGLYSNEGVIDENNVKEYFLKTRKKDKRFKSQQDKELGISLEISRIKTIWENANTLLKVFDAHPEIFAQEFSSFTFGDKVYQGNYAIELSKLKGKEGKNISNAFKTSRVDEESNEVFYTVEEIYLFIGENTKENGDLEWEALAYLRTLFETYTNFITD